MKRVVLISALFFLVSIPHLFAGTTGKLAGRVTDTDTKEGLFGVNVILEGTNFGAATDINGYYMINNIPPGDYTVTFSAVGYQKKSFTKVKISVDFTSKLDVDLGVEAVQMEAIIVEAKQPLVRQDLTSSHTSIDATQISSLPVESISQILTLQAGVTTGTGGDIHIRGGRSNEIAFTVNGVSISNPFDNTATVTIATNAIQELSVISGTFNAEYGGAMSGIVNTVTKEGGNDYKGFLSFYTGDYLSTRKETFFNVDKFSGLNNMVGELTFGGPIPGTNKSLGFFVSGRYNDNKGWLYGIRQHVTSDSIFINPDDPNDIRLAMNGDMSKVSMNPSRRFSGTGKLTYKPTTTIKLNYDLIYSISEGRSYSHDWKYNPDGLPEYHDNGITNVFELRHAVSNSTFYSLKGSYNINYYSSYLYPMLNSDGSEVTFRANMNPLDYIADHRYQPIEKLVRPNSYTFYLGGTSNDHSYEDAKTFLGKFDITSQVSRNHEVKFGLEGRLHTLEYRYFSVRRDRTTYTTPTVLDLTSPYSDYYKKEPVEFSGYIQDKMEFDNLIVNLGLRYDYFDAKSQYSLNITYPSPNDPKLPPYIDKSTLLGDSKAKHQISPRLGVSFPITDKGIIHFSYGHFFQMPPFRYLYANSSFKYSFASGEPTIGNANLKPEKTVSYEIGLQQELLPDLAFNVTGFYKDVRDLLALENIRVSGDQTYTKYVNKDYGNIKGVTFSLTKRRSGEDMLGVTLDYTLQVAEGNDTDADAFFLDLSSGRQSEKTVIYLPWDQTHTLNATISFGVPNDWNLSLIGQLGTGLPYTPTLYEQQVLLRTNSSRRPSTANVDLLAEKMFNYMGIKFSVFLKIFNLFDTLNERLVYGDTGRSTYTLQLMQGGVKSAQNLADRVEGIHSTEDYFSRPNYYYPPREVRLGMSLEF
ncbi:MAG TPA: TonB-dependent receptor [Ignavibacteriaceae bacterium]|jgi:outer membrane receptor protein involved in Fe transport|nr:TonB-dependent receptor [Ignavibacteriaceae bacterium]HOJ19178.1 TonB-dependent receptor [Ignavibacteriaceae bacterium]HPO54697.1 TonB-dependent receptor [Ignavibacteriaceae bacterium]